MPTATSLLEHDEHPRAGTTLEGLAKLRPAFAEMGELTYDDDRACERYPHVDHIDHVHHAGNSSGVVDGAAAAVVASAAWIDANGVTPRARVRATAAVGSEPVIMLTAPGPAAERCPGPGRDDAPATSTSGRSTKRSPRSR